MKHDTRRSLLWECFKERNLKDFIEILSYWLQFEFEYLLVSRKWK